ncbi:MAG TPA: hypothetical protein VFG53_18740 [Anaeromyxobacter sp.]|nr:hypothetical protein [Anaeromyxobacter sp.]
MSEPSTAFAVLDFPADEPIAFMGPPGALRAEVRLANPSGERRVFRAGEARLEGTSLSPAAVRPSLPVVLEAGASRRIALTVELPPRTPPGAIGGEVLFGDTRHRAEFFVVEHVSLEISPGELFVEATPGETVRRQMVFRNAGNVPLEVTGPLPVPLEAEPLPGQRLARALEALRAEPAGPATSAGAKQGREPKLPLARLGPLGGSAKLAPGQTALVEMGLEIPRGLEPGTRYLGAAPLQAATLRLVVLAKAEKGTHPPKRKA